MFLRKTKSAPILKPSSTFNKESDRLNRNVIYLQTMIDDMIQEYQYMDRPLKYPRNPEPSPITSITDKSIFLNQRNDYIPKKQCRQNGHLINSYPSIILDKVIIHRQPITEMKYLEETDRNNLFKEANFIKTVTFPFLTPHPYHYVFLHPFLFHTRNIPHNNRRQ